MLALITAHWLCLFQVFSRDMPARASLRSLQPHQLYGDVLAGQALPTQPAITFAARGLSLAARNG